MPTKFLVFLVKLKAIKIITFILLQYLLVHSSLVPDFQSLFFLLISLLFSYFFFNIYWNLLLSHTIVWYFLEDFLLPSAFFEQLHSCLFWISQSKGSLQTHFLLLLSWTFVQTSLLSYFLTLLSSVLQPSPIHHLHSQISVSGQQEILLLLEIPNFHSLDHILYFPSKYLLILSICMTKLTEFLL